MKDYLDIGLFLAGIALVILSLASVAIPSALGWKEKLAGLTPLMREMWWTYSLYVWASHVFFAVLSLGYRDWMLSGESGAAALTGFVFLWWAVRLGLQFFGFDLKEVEDTLFNRIAKHLLTLLFLALVIVFGAATGWNLGWWQEGGV